jgi:hypothetical protein
MDNAQRTQALFSGSRNPTSSDPTTGVNNLDAGRMDFCVAEMT